MNNNMKNPSTTMDTLYQNHLKVMTQLDQKNAHSAPNHRKNQSKYKFKNLPTVADYHELRKAYKFIMPPITSKDEKSQDSTSISWQERMARQYHSYLFKSFAIADLSRVSLDKPGVENEKMTSNPKVGLRWRIEREVRQGIGQFTCGNKNCPSFRTVVPYDKQRMEYYFQHSFYSHDTSDEKTQNSAAGGNESLTSKSKRHTVEKIAEENERKLLEKIIPFGMGLHSYEVNFEYVEDKVRKNELVKLRLCMRCAPYLFASKGGALGAKGSRETNNGENNHGDVHAQQQHYWDQQKQKITLSKPSYSKQKKQKDRRPKSNHQKNKHKHSDTDESEPSSTPYSDEESSCISSKKKGSNSSSKSGNNGSKTKCNNGDKDVPLDIYMKKKFQNKKEKSRRSRARQRKRSKAKHTYQSKDERYKSHLREKR